MDCADGKLKRDSNDRKAADVAQQADVAIRFSPLSAAEIQNAKPANGKVVTDGVGGIEFC